MKKYITFLLIINIFAGVELFARDIYVSPSGSSTLYTRDNPGGIKSALTIAQPGDTIYCLDGTYVDSSASYWSTVFNPARSGTSTAPITIKSYNLQGAYFKSKIQNYPGISINGRSYIVIDGIKSDAIQFYASSYGTVKNCEVINGYLQSGSGTDISLHWGIVLEHSNHCLVQNNYVHNMFDKGNHGHNSACIMVFGSSDFNIIEYNTVDGSYPNGAPNNIYNAYGTKAGDMDDNIWRYNFGANCVSGFMAMGDTAETNYTQRNKLHNNVIIKCTQFLEHHHGGVDWEIYNNTFYSGSRFILGKYYTDSSSVCPRDSHVWNNLVHTATDFYHREPSSVDWRVFIAYSNYNQVYNNTYYASYAWGSAHYSLSSFRSATGFDGNSFAANPGFVKAGGSSPLDYRLTSYAANGRGGAYASVIGAYVTGNETIGYRREGVVPVSPQDTSAPSRPTGVNAVINP